MSDSPEYSPFFAVMGASAAMVFSGMYIYVIVFNLVIVFCHECFDVIHSWISRAIVSMWDCAWFSYCIGDVYANVNWVRTGKLTLASYRK